MLRAVQSSPTCRGQSRTLLWKNWCVWLQNGASETPGVFKSTRCQQIIFLNLKTDAVLLGLSGFKNIRAQMPDPSCTTFYSYLGFSWNLHLRPSPPSPNLDPLRKTAKSPGSSHKAQYWIYRVFKLRFLDQPCDFSSSLLCLTSGGLERALFKLNLVLYFLIRLDLAYCVHGETHCRGLFSCVIVCTLQLTKLYSSARDGSLVTS